MKLDDAAAIAEIIGAVAIVASLIFVGTQVSQNTDALRTATVQAIADQDSAQSLALATDERLSELFAQLATDPEALTDTDKISLGDRLRVSMVLRANLRRVENIYLHVKAGVVEPEALDRIGYGWYQMLLTDKFWQSSKSGFDSEFVEFMEQKIFGDVAPSTIE
jgi:hypothetical protein